MPRRQLLLVGLAAVLALGACQAPPTAPAEATAQAQADVGDHAPLFPWERAARGETVKASVPLSEIRPGGPPPDGIPPIDDPVFESVDEAGAWLTDRDPVLVVQLEGRTRAYPLAILTYHEIVNDRIGDRPVLITYCPLCNSGLVFDPTLDGEVLTFGTSGRLWRSNLVMYDRATRSLWSQFTGEAIAGELTGAHLERLPMQIVSWADLRVARPDAQVLSRDTGHSRPYGTNPYVSYDSSASPFLFDGETGGPLSQMARVVTTGGQRDPVAYPLETLRQRRVIADRVAGREVVVLWTPGTASALDTSDLSQGDDVGSTGVFVPAVDGRMLTFEPAGEDAFRDRETASTWTILGEAVDGPLAGARLQRVPHDDTFWFVQDAFRPDTRVHTPAAGRESPSSASAPGQLP